MQVCDNNMCIQVWFAYSVLHQLTCQVKKRIYIYICTPHTNKMAEEKRRSVVAEEEGGNDGS